MVAAFSSPALKIYPPFQHYSNASYFASFSCYDDNDDDLSNEDKADIEWLSSDFTLMNSTSRICGCYF